MIAKKIRTSVLAIAAAAAMGASVSSNAALVSSGTVAGGAGANWFVCGGYSLICDGHINGNFFDTFDGTMRTRVNSTDHNNANGSSQVDITGQVATGFSETLFGLSVSETTRFDTASATARMIVSFTNRGTAGITVTVGSHTNMGSDSRGVTSATSSGDTTFDALDRWMISQDLSTGDAVSAYVMQGAGAVTADMFSVLGSAESGDFDGQFMLTVGAGETVSMMYFAQMYGTVADAQAGMLRFDSLSAADSLVSDLTAGELARIQNWNFAAVPEPGSLALVGIGVLLAGLRRNRSMSIAAGPR